MRSREALRTSHGPLGQGARGGSLKPLTASVGAKMVMLVVALVSKFA